MKPERIQLSRKKGWRMPPNTVKVDRSTIWGNHWIVWQDPNENGQWIATRNSSEHHPVGTKAEGIAVAVREHARELKLKRDSYGFASWLLPLRGKNLACWCQPDQPCHADVLIELANA